MLQYKRLLAAIMFVATLIIMSSCNAFGTTENLLKPPRLSGQQEEIYTALTKTLNKNDISFRYPQVGETKNAIFYYDLYGDYRNEAIVLYALSSQPAETRVHILTQNDSGEWETLCDISQEGAQVDRIDFAKLSPDTGYNQLLVGWRLFGTSVNRLDVYDINYQGVSHYNLILSRNYQEMIYNDVDSDNQTELVILVDSSDANSTDTYARLYKYGQAQNKNSAVNLPNGDPTQFYMVAETKITRMRQYLQIKAGILPDVQSADPGNNVKLKNEHNFGIYIDGQIADNSYTTELVYYDYKNGQLLTPFLQTPIKRKTDVRCQDINGDSYIEFPTESILENGIASIEWNTYIFSSGNLRQATTLVNSTWNYMIMLKEQWAGVVDVEAEDDGTWTLYYIDKQTKKRTVPIMTVRGWLEEEWESKKSEYGSDIPFRNIANIQFTVQIFDDNSVSADDLKLLFKPLFL